MYAVNTAIYNTRNYCERFLMLLDKWINDSTNFIEEFVYGDMECFLKEFTDEDNCQILYRGLCLKNTNGRFNNYSNEELLEYLQKHKNVFASSSRDFKIAKEFAEMDRTDDDELSLIVEMKADKFMYLPEDTYEKEVILYKPRYTKILWKRF